MVATRIFREAKACQEEVTFKQKMAVFQLKSISSTCNAMFLSNPILLQKTISRGKNFPTKIKSNFDNGSIKRLKANSLKNKEVIIREK